MEVTCNQCQLRYDDARKSTICPHQPIAPDVILDRKDLAYKVFFSKKKYKVRGSERTGTITSVDHWGMVSLSGGDIYEVYDPNSLEEVE